MPKPVVRSFEAKRKFLSAKLRARREELGMTQLMLAMESEVDRTFISQIERCVGNPSLRTLCRIADTLGVPVCALICDESTG